ncbi:MAG: hypothetical protein ACTHMZ_12345 [Actinomycetes bacterium]
MEVIVWWTIPLVATVLALVWVFWVSRPRPPEDLHESLESYERFKAALEPRPSRRPWWQRRGQGRRPQQREEDR